MSAAPFPHMPSGHSRPPIEPSASFGPWIDVNRKKNGVPRPNRSSAIPKAAPSPAPVLNSAEIPALRKQDPQPPHPPRPSARQLLEKRSLRPNVPLSFSKSASPASWREVCVGTRPVVADRELRFIDPVRSDGGQRLGLVPNCLKTRVASRWEFTLVGHVLGDAPYYSQLRAVVGRQWRLKHPFRIFSRANGVFFFKFGSMEDCESVLFGGPWLFDGRLLILRRWSGDVTMDRDLLKSVPVWIRLPSFPTSLWSTEILSIATSLVGNPICVDKATAHLERIDYARCFVEVHADAPLPRCITLAFEDGSTVQLDVEYEGEPPRCEQCLSFGHLKGQCPFDDKGPSGSSAPTVDLESETASTHQLEALFAAAIASRRAEEAQIEGKFNGGPSDVGQPSMADAALGVGPEVEGTATITDTNSRPEPQSCTGRHPDDQPIAEETSHVGDVNVEPDMVDQVAGGGGNATDETPNPGGTTCNESSLKVPTTAGGVEPNTAKGVGKSTSREDLAKAKDGEPAAARDPASDNEFDVDHLDEEDIGYYDDFAAEFNLELGNFPVRRRRTATRGGRGSRGRSSGSRGGGRANGGLHSSEQSWGWGSSQAAEPLFPLTMANSDWAAKFGAQSSALRLGAHADPPGHPL